MLNLIYNISEKFKYSDFTVLYRMNAQSRSIEEILNREGIPYKIIGGLKFYERKEIKDAIANLIYNISCFIIFIVCSISCN